MNESEDPESTRDISSVSGIDSEVTGIFFFLCHFIVLQGGPYDGHYIHGEDEGRSAQALTSPPPLPLMHEKNSY